MSRDAPNSQHMNSSKMRPVMGSPSEGGLPSDLLVKMSSACVGALITSLTMTPFDVVKTRMQVQRPAASVPSLATSPHCAFYQLNNGLMSTVCTKKGCEFFSGCEVPRITGTFDGFVKLARHEGVASLWNGLPPTLLMSIPATVLYFTAYDELRANLLGAPWMPAFAKDWSPLLAGSIARTTTCTLVSPIELVRTRLQSQSGNGARQTSWGIVKSETALGGPLALWRGLAATLWRDVPFSAVYWMGYERCKAQLASSSLFLPLAPTASTAGEGGAGGARGGGGAAAAAATEGELSDGTLEAAPRLSAQDTFSIAFMSGAASGMLASVLTIPFDVVKTRRQIDFLSSLPEKVKEQGGARAGTAVKATTNSSTWSILNQIVAEEGTWGLFNGLAPRVMKVAPACAIMISTYEAGKQWQANNELNNW